jgi:hypothetical protein
MIILFYTNSKQGAWHSGGAGDRVLLFSFFGFVFPRYFVFSGVCWAGFDMVGLRILHVFLPFYSTSVAGWGGLGWFFLVTVFRL